MQADLGVGGGLGVEFGDDLAVEHHEQPVGECHHLVEFGRDDQHGGAAVTLLDDPGVDVLDRADVDPAGRLRCDDEIDVATELASGDHLLLVAARQRRQFDVDAGRADVVLLDQFDGVIVSCAPVHDDAVRIRLVVVRVEHDVLAHGEAEHQPTALAVLGDVGDARSVHLARRRGGEVLALDPDVAGEWRAEPSDRLDEFGLTVALDTGDPDDLAGPDLELDTLDGLLVAIVEHDEVVDVEHDVFGLAGSFWTTRSTGRPTIKRGQFVFGGLAGNDFGDGATLAHHDDPVGDRRGPL